MKKSDIQKLLKEKQNEDYQKLCHEHFKTYVEGLEEKPYDLNEEKPKIANELFIRFLNGEIKDVKTLARSVLKSYMNDKEEEIVSYVSFEDLAIKKPNELVSKFLNENIIDVSEKRDFDSNEIYEVLANLFMDKLEDVFGNYIFLNFSSEMGKEYVDLKKKIVEKYKERGFQTYQRENKFLLREGIEIQNIIPENQLVVLNAFIEIVQDYVKKYDFHINEDFTTEQYQEYWNVIEMFLNNLESRMTKETMSSEEFVNSKQIYENIKSQKEKIRRTITKEGRNGDYYKSLKICLKHFSDGQETEEDKKLLNDFYKKIEKVYSALCIVDENGQNYPVNYFVCMPIHPATIMSPLLSIQKLGILNEEQIQVVSKTKSLIRNSFPTNYLRNTGDMCNIPVVLTNLRTRRQCGDSIIDLTDDKVFDNFVDKIDGFLEKNNLPQSSLCVSFVARDFIKGRNPINLDSKKYDKIKE